MRPLTIVPNTKNTKLNGCAATYVSQASCPPSCPLLHAGCYAETGWAGITTHRLAKSSTNNPIVLASMEAAEIDNLPGDKKLRVHVVGDSATSEAAEIVGQAMVDYEDKQGMPAWTYTHGWRDVKESDWQGANVLASCETGEEVKTAKEEQGYATCIVTPKHPSHKVYEYQGVNVLPCPEQFGLTDCSKCGICMAPNKLKELNLTVGFSAHGSRKDKVITMLQERN